ncbi:MAG: translation initiation factor IF-2, partial [Planctomycetota bacterium]|nr:translation initiation factor IF-2 [Planctomycetota bacterium]
EHECEIEVLQAADVEEDVPELEFEDRPEDMSTRAPVVAFLGHVDHGKTSLLDRIRESQVAESEAGGITQHIGAYRVDQGEKHVVFLDTPGHEAFTEMRARGAGVTDVVVLVVAADDGVMPQTVEAINHARAAEVKICVAVNKIDKPNANIQKTMQQLAAQGLNPVEWGGDIEFVKVSATTGEGIDDLLETLSLEAEILDLKANPNRPAMGTVLEAHISEGRGNVAHVLIENGTLRRGDIVLCGPGYGKVKALYNDKGPAIETAGPSTPVEITGLSEVPEAGDRLIRMKDLKEASRYAQRRLRRRRDANLADRRHVTLDNLFSKLEEGKAKEVRVIIKADVKGSLQPLRQELTKLGTDEVKVKIIHSDVGGITESDVMLADASDAVLIGFHVVPDEKARSLAEERSVDVRLYRVIYEATDEVRKALEGLLDPERRENVKGHLEIREVFRASKVGRIAGCHVLDGNVERGGLVRLLRDSVVIYEGRIDTLRRFKEDVKEVREGFDCGVRIAGYDDIKVSDVIETYEIQEIARSLS